MFDEDWFTGKGDSKGFTSKAIADLRKRKEEEQYSAEILKQEQAKAEDQKKKEEHSKESVFTRAKNVGKGVGNFVKDAAVDLKDTTVGTWQGLGDVARGELASNSLDEITKQRNEMSKRHNKEMNDILGNAEDATKLDAAGKKKWDEFVARSQKETADFEAKVKAGEAQSNEDIATSQKVDAKKTAFAAASTFLNATLVYGAAEAGAKAVGTQVIKGLAKDSIEQMVKTGGTEALEQIIKSGSKDAAEQAVKQLTKEVGKEAADTFLKRAVSKAAPEALMGSAYGAIETGKNNPNATAGDYLKGAAIGGTVGAVIPLAGEAVKKVGGEIVSKIAEKSATGKAAQAIVDEGLTAAERINDTGLKSKINSIFNPIKNLAEETQTAFKNSAGGQYVSKIKQNIMEKRITQMADEAGVKLDMNLVHDIESGKATGEFAQQFRDVADSVRKEATDAGMDLGYRENYVPHIWKQSPEEIQKIAKAKGFNLKAIAEGKRIVPTYQEGIELGLTPKHTNPAKMMADYAANLEKARTNVALFKDLKDQAVLGSKQQPGWKVITAEGFPKQYNGAPMYAPKQVADVINNIYGKSDSLIEKGLRKTAHFNSMWQDIALAGGVPHTPANFFTFSQMMKEGAVGLGQMVTGQPIRGMKTIYSPMVSFMRAFSEKESTQFQLANEKFLTKLADAGAPIQFAEASAKGGIKDAFVWDKMFNQPTFGRFMPNLQLSTAKNVYNNLARKMTSEEAMAATADVMKKMYGITDQMATGRAQGVQDLIGSVGFAPKYRESIINVLGNTIKSLDPRTYGDVSYSLNRRLAAGMGVTFLIYDQLNKQTTGHGMFQNPSGKELSLAIPYGGKDADGNQKVVYIPFMPSFLTLPRAGVDIVRSAAKGDEKGVVQGVSKFASMPLQTGGQLATNQDYFGRPIYIDENTARLTHKEQDTPGQMLKKQGAYLLGQSSPAVVRAGIDAASGKPIEQNLATAGEAPVRFGKFSSASTKDQAYAPGEVTSDFYKTYNPVSAKRRTASAEITALIKAGKPNEARRRAAEFNATLPGKFSELNKKYGNTKAWDPEWDEMMSGLFIRTGERSIEARQRQ